MLRPVLSLLSAACLSVTALAACGSGEEEGPARSGLPVTTTSTTAPSEEPAADDDEPSVSIASPQDGAAVPGNVVTLEVDVTGIEIVSADGDTSGTTGHLHVFVDREPPPVGEVIPREPGIIHTTESTIVVPGLPPEEHRLVVTLGDGEHRRISEELTAEVTVTVEGPALDAQAASPVRAGEDVVVDVTLEGVSLGGAEDGHLHVIVDGDYPPAGEPIPMGPGVQHFTEPRVTISGLEAGEHTIWVVLGTADHVPWDPPVADQLSVTVE